jgi:hypothetical protein
MMLSFLKECKVLPVENSVAAGKATTVGEIIDTAGYGGACFIYKLGTVVDGAAVTLKVYQGSNATVTDVAELDGASAAIATASTDSEQRLIVDVIKPRERYLRPTIVTATENVEIDDAICILYNPDVIPVTQPATVDASALVVSPAEA